MKRILAAFAANTVFANIVMVMIFLGGALALGSMLRESFPQFSLDMISVQVLYPGADPEEVEEGIVLKIEEALETVEGIKQCTTTSSENVGSASIEVQDGYDVTEVLDNVKAKIDAISTFPVDAEKPVVTEVLMKDSVMLLALSATIAGALGMGCGGDEGTTPNCPKGNNNCFTVPDGGAASPDAGAKDSGAQDSSAQDSSAKD